MKCCNLDELRVAETKLTISEIVADILPKCSQVTKLSFSLKMGDWLSFAAHLGKRKKPTLGRLKSIEMMVANKPTALYEILHFLQSCENVEEIFVGKAWIPESEMNVDDKLSYFNPGILKSLVFVAKPLAGPNFSHQVSKFFDVREGVSNLTTFWCNILELHNGNHLNKLTSVAWNTPELRDQQLPINVLHPGLQLGHLESYWEPEPVLMRSVLDSQTKLKLISCFYDGRNFQNFCENHPLLEELKLNSWTLTLPEDRKQSPKVWNRDSWKNLSRLRILSLSAVLISESTLPYLKSIVQSCPLIQELEIMGTVNKCPNITGDELSSIAQLGPTLKRLTLTKISVKNGLFLERILNGCDQLESLRLKSISSSSGEVPWCCADNLIRALPLAKNLKTFCLFQKNVPQMELLLDSLESCTSISRLGLVCPSSSFNFNLNLSKEEVIGRFIRLCDKLSQLVALFCFLNVPFETMKEVNQVLKKKFKTERPAFRSDMHSKLFENLQRTNNGEIRCHCDLDLEAFPIMYHDLLTSCQSRVALVPLNSNTFLRRTN